MKALQRRGFSNQGSTLVAFTIFLPTQSKQGAGIKHAGANPENEAERLQQ